MQILDPSPLWLKVAAKDPTLAKPNLRSGLLGWLKQCFDNAQRPSLEDLTQAIEAMDPAFARLARQ